MAAYRLENIVQRYSGKTVLSVKEWSVTEGAITGLYGPNGSGKSTLLRLLGFTETPEQGKIYFRGRGTESYAGNLRSRVTLMPQESYLLKRSVYQNIAYGLRIRGDRSNEKERVGQAMSLVGLDAGRFADRPWYALSGGEARRAAMAARLVLNPEVLLLDEPTTSVDAKSAQMMKQAAYDSHIKYGATLVIASHDLQWLEDICHDIVHMFNGKILGKGGKALIFGPWEKAGGGGVLRKLSDGQVFVAQNAPDDPEGAAAALDPRDLTFHTRPEEVPSGKAALKGLIMRLSLEKHTGRISAAIHAGRAEFVIYFDPQTVSGQGYQPGAYIWVAYYPDRVKWYGASAD